MWECDHEAQICYITSELYMMDCFHQRAGVVLLRPNCAVLLQVQAAGETQDIFQNIESMKS